ncbi:MAG TPA: GNAT family N-acetyltransferase [Gemmatimonadaceae bacterium]
MITLRPIVVADAIAIAAAVDQSRDALRRWMVWYSDDYDVGSAAAWIEQSLRETARGIAKQFAVIDEHEMLIGVVGIEGIDHTSGRAMIGYWLATPATNRGSGRHAVEQALAWGRTQPHLRTVWAVVADVNIASRRVLELNGFRRTDVRGTDERGDTALIYELDLRAAPALH